MSFIDNSDEQTQNENHPKRFPLTRIRVGLISAILGFIIFLLGARPSLFNLDRSPVIGFVQIAMFLVGLGIMCIGGYISIKGIWHGQQLSIAADIGMRLVATGFVVAVFAGMADVFGVGSHPLPDVPYFGGWQSRGVEIGELVIAFGFLLMLPIGRKDKTQFHDPVAEKHDF